MRAGDVGRRIWKWVVEVRKGWMVQIVGYGVGDHDVWGRGQGEKRVLRDFWCLWLAVRLSISPGTYARSVCVVLCTFSASNIECYYCSISSL